MSSLPPYFVLHPIFIYMVLDCYVFHFREKKHSQYGGYSELCAQFYLKLMVPRNVWPTENYGWLCDSVSFSILIMVFTRVMTYRF